MSPQEIKQARLELGVSRAQLAAILGTDTRHVRRLEAEAGCTRQMTLAVPLGWLMLALAGKHWPLGWSAG